MHGFPVPCIFLLFRVFQRKSAVAKAPFSHRVFDDYIRVIGMYTITRLFLRWEGRRQRLLPYGVKVTSQSSIEKRVKSNKLLKHSELSL